MYPSMWSSRTPVITTFQESLCARMLNANMLNLMSWDSMRILWRKPQSSIPICKVKALLRYVLLTWQRDASEKEGTRSTGTAKNVHQKTTTFIIVIIINNNINSPTCFKYHVSTKPTHEFTLALRVLEGRKKVWETCSFHPVIIACQNSFMGPRYDQKTVLSSNT